MKGRLSFSKSWPVLILLAIIMSVACRSNSNEPEKPPAAPPQPKARHKGSVTIGVYRPSINAFLLRNSNTPGNPDVTMTYGIEGDFFIAGDWNGDGTETVGVY